MMIELQITNTAENEAKALLALLSNDDIVVLTPALDHSDTSIQRDGATVLAALGVILAVPSAIEASINLANRREIRDAVEALKTRLKDTDSDGILRLKNHGEVDVCRTSTDATVDLLLKDLGHR